MIHVALLDSRLLCHEKQRRILNGTWDSHSVLDGPFKVSLYHTCASWDGAVPKPGSKRELSLKFDVPCVAIDRVLEQRIFGGSRYAFNEYQRMVKQLEGRRAARMTPVDRWNRWRNRKC